MTQTDMSIADALTRLHAGTDRQGPGDDAFSQSILDRLPADAKGGRIADLGSGSGVASLLLATHLQQPVLAVDTAQPFLDALQRSAVERGLGALITPLCADMGALDPARHQFDLIWSEGAAYNLTFGGAMRSWRPLLAAGGIAVVSEMSWFGPDRPAEVQAFWGQAYPEMASEAENIATASQHGFELLFTERLPEAAWWRTYYDPLLQNLDRYADAPEPMMQTAIAETRIEIDLFRRYAAYYGYTFYVLKAV